MPNGALKIVSGETLSSFLLRAGNLSSTNTLRIVVRLTKQVCRLHKSGRYQFRILPETIQLDSTGRASLPEPEDKHSFGGSFFDEEFCPPALRRPDALEIPTDSEGARRVLKQAGVALEPAQIDIYQLGALLCRLATGESVQNYLRSPRAKAAASGNILPLIDRALGYYPKDCFREANQFLEEIEGLQKELQQTVAAEQHADAAKDDTALSMIQGGTPDDTDVSMSPENPLSRDARRDVENELPFSKLGHYEIVSRIGHGGMGDVYKGYERALDRTLAIKVLPPELSRDDSFVQRFQAEATAAAKLIHPNILQIHFIGEDAGHHFFAMQYIDGESLAELLARRGPLKINNALAIIEQTLSGLAAAHQQGMVHRDIKPGNILLDSKNHRALVADFGLVKSLQSSEAITATGMLMGTADYISPEQGRGQDVDQRTDLYSIGVVIYQMLSGRLPFKADTPTALIFQHVYEAPPPLNEVAPKVPIALASVVSRLMAKLPADRYQSAEELLTDLQAFRAGEPLPSGADVLGTDKASAPPAVLAAFESTEGQPGIGSIAATTSFHTAIIQAPRFGEAPLLPTDLQEPAAGDWWQRLCDRFRDLVRQQAPGLAEHLQNTQQQVDGAVAEYERRHEALRQLIGEAEGVVMELAKQRKSWKAAAVEADITADKKAQCDAMIAELGDQIRKQQEQLEEMQVRLAKIGATTEQLRSQRLLLNARLRMAQARARVAGGAGAPGFRQRLIRLPSARPKLVLAAATVLLVVCVLIAVVIFSENSPDKPAPEGVIATTPFGNSVIESIKNSVTPSPTSVAPIENFGPSVPGRAPNYALQFSGSEFVELPSTSGLLDLNGDFTIEMWVRWPEVPPRPQDYQILTGYEAWRGTDKSVVTTDTLLSWVLRLQEHEGKYHLNFVYTPERSSWAELNSGIFPYTSDWQHIALSKQGKTIRLFRNGELAVSRTDTVKLNDTAGLLYFGPHGHIGRGNRRFDGEFKAYRVSKAALYTADFTPSETLNRDGRTLALLDFSKANGDVLPDLTGNGHDGTISGAKWLNLAKLNSVDVSSTSTATKPDRPLGSNSEAPARIKTASFPRPDLLLQPTAGDDWKSVPDFLEGAKIYFYSKTFEARPPVAKFSIERSGIVYLACYFGNEGNSSGGWKEQALSAEEFQQQGWIPVGELRTGKGRIRTVFRRPCSKGESFALRCNKHHPPLVILRHDVAGLTVPAALVKKKPALAKPNAPLTPQKQAANSPSKKATPPPTKAGILSLPKAFLTPPKTTFTPPKKKKTVPASPKKVATSPPKKQAAGILKPFNAENVLPNRINIANAKPVPLKQSKFPGEWDSIPGYLNGAVIFSDLKHPSSPTAEFSVSQNCMVYLACNFGYEGSARSGWRKTALTKNQFNERGWISVIDLWSNSKGARRQIRIFRKPCKKSESYSLRCNKYTPPMVILVPETSGTKNAALMQKHLALRTRHESILALMDRFFTVRWDKDLNVTEIDVLVSPRGSKFTDSDFHYLTNIPEVRKLSIRYAKKVTDKGLAALEGMTGIEELSLQNMELTGEALVPLSRLPRLRKLSLKHTVFISQTRSISAKEADIEDTSYPRDFKHLANLKKFEHVTDLDLSCLFLADADLVHLEGMPQLERLDISYNPPITDKGMQHLSQLHNLKSLLFKGTQVSDAGLKVVAGLPNLEELRFWDNSISDDGLVSLASKTKLKKLAFINMPITNRGIAHLKGLENLEELVLTRSRITNAGMEHLKSMTKLQTLMLYHSDIDNKGLHVLENFKNLRVLALANTGVNNAGLVHLKNLKQLEELHLGNTRVTDKGLKHLDGLKSLKILSLNSTKVSNQGLTHLLALPELARLSIVHSAVNVRGLEYLMKIPKLEALYVHKEQFSKETLRSLKAKYPKLQILIRK